MTRKVRLFFMNRKIVCSLLLAFACVIAGILGCTTNSADRTLKDIGYELGIDIGEGEIVKLEDTHGGFHGDGSLLVTIKFANNKLENKLADSKEWQAFPLDKTAQTLLYGNTIEDEQVGPFVTDRDGNKLFPPVKKGYYWLRDRQPEFSKSTVNSLSNFTVAIYDTQKDTLYYCKMDT